MKLEHEENHKRTKEIITHLQQQLPSPENENHRRRKTSQAAGRTGKRKGSWENDKKMLEMEEQLKETKKNQTFPP